MFAVGSLVLALGCQGEYPLAPTLCDEWCDATRGFSCDFYDPAACVAECEDRGYTRNEACTQVLRAALGCVRETPRAASWQCSLSFPVGEPPCQAQFQALYECEED
jgi:hypothetical protein